MGKILKNSVKVIKSIIKVGGIIIAICAATYSIIGVVGFSRRRR